MMKSNRTRVIYAFLASAAIAFAARFARPDARLVVHVFDVGQGDAILAQCGTAQLLVDGGPDATVLSRLGATMPFFDRRIDAMVLTHPHADHFVGLVGVLRKYRVDRVFVSTDAADSPDYAAFQDALRASGVTPAVVVPGDRIAVGECGHATVLWPNRAIEGISWDDPNAESVVLRVARDDATDPRDAALLMGDATAEVEAALRASGAPLAADFLKVGHHGSRFSSTPAFLDAVRPVTAAISVGAKNRYGHPAEATMRRLSAVGARVLRTNVDGEIAWVLGRAP